MKKILYVKMNISDYRVRQVTGEAVGGGRVTRMDSRAPSEAG